MKLLLTKENRTKVERRDKIEPMLTNLFMLSASLQATSELIEISRKMTFKSKQEYVDSKSIGLKETSKLKVCYESWALVYRIKLKYNAFQTDLDPEKGVEIKNMMDRFRSESSAMTRTDCDRKEIKFKAT